MLLSLLDYYSALSCWQRVLGEVRKLKKVIVGAVLGLLAGIGVYTYWSLKNLTIEGMEIEPVEDKWKYKEEDSKEGLREVE